MMRRSVLTVLFPVFLAGCATPKPAPTLPQTLAQEDVETTATNLTGNYFFTCFVEQAEGKGAFRPRQGIPGSAAVTLQLRTDEAGLVQQTSAVTANFPKKLVDPCLQEVLSGLRATKKGATTVLARIHVDVKESAVSYRLEAADGIEYKGSASPK